MFSLKKIFSLAAIPAIALLILSACAAPDTATPTEEPEHSDEHNDDHSHGGEDHDRLPNDGAVIRIVSPEDGAVFASGEDILVEIEIENFELNVDGTHWHVYVDGETYGMVVGENYRQVLRGLTPGDHEISAYLGLGTHEELEDGSAITITVNE